MRLRRATHWEDLALVSALILGGVLRLSLPLLAGFPINDGGLFYVMVQELCQHHYVLPMWTSYNNLRIPFVYPPVSLYLIALLWKVFAVPLEELFRWVPAIAATATVPAFYGMARALLRSRSGAACATVAFALVPRSYLWLVMGGGVGRSLAQLLLILTVWALVPACRERSCRALLLALVLGGLVVLTHPEVALHMVAIGTGEWLFLGRGRWKFGGLVTFGLGIAAVSCPWWLTCLARYGLVYFLSALATGHHSVGAVFFFLAPGFAQEGAVSLGTVMGLIGVFAAWVCKRYFLLYWLAVPFLAEPRSAATQAVLPLALLAGTALADVVLPGMRLLESRLRLNEPTGVADQGRVHGSVGQTVRAMLLYFLFLAFLASALESHSFLGKLSPSQRSAMEWARAETPPGSHFLILSGAGEPFLDGVSEWFPAISGRISLNTLQGREWLLGSRYTEFRQDLMKLQQCLNADVDCLDQWTRKYGVDFDYLYIVKVQTQGIAIRVDAEMPRFLLSQVARSNQYRLVYDSEGVAIYRHLTRER